jgi:hypothetical protein
MSRAESAACRAALWIGALLSATGVSVPSAAEETPPAPSAKASVKARIERLEIELSRLKEDHRHVQGGGATEERLADIEQGLRLLARDLAEIKAATWKREDQAGERDARLDDLAEETSLIWGDLDAVKRETAALRAHPAAGYGDGFFIRSPDNAFRLTINGFVRPYYRLVLQRPHEDDFFATPDRNGARLSPIAANGLGLENARLAVAVRMLRVLSGRFEIDFGALTGEAHHPPRRGFAAGTQGHVTIDEYALRLMDAYAEYAPLEALFVRCGQFRVPFDAESRFLDNELTFTTRALLTRRYLVFGDSPYLDEEALFYHYGFEWQRGSRFGRDLGVSLGGRVLGGRFNYEAGVFNGAGLNAPNDNRDVLAAVRLFSDALGPMSDGMSDTAGENKPLLRIGAGFAFDLPRHESQFDPGNDYNSADYNVTADLHLKWRGLSLLASFFYRYSDHGSALFDVVPDETGTETARDKPVQSMGLSGQIAYYHARSRLEPAVRYALYDARLHLVDDHVHEITGALNFHVYPKHFKLIAEYRGLLPQDTRRSYLAPLGTGYDYLHELSLMAEVSF